MVILPLGIRYFVKIKHIEAFKNKKFLKKLYSYTMNETLQKLRLSEQITKELFKTIEDKGFITHGKTEQQLCNEIVQVAKEDFGIEQYWGKKIVRTGINTLQPYISNPPNLLIQKDDILFFDFHPIFENWEADLGRTYVLGNDPIKLKIKKDVEAAWYEANTWYFNQTQ